MRVLFKFTVYELLRKADVLAERYFQKPTKRRLSRQSTSTRTNIEPFEGEPTHLVRGDPSLVG